MRGIPSSILVFFFASVFLVELISYFGFRLLIHHASKKRQRYLGIFYLLISIAATGILFYAFSNPEIIRQSRNYTFYYIVVLVSVLNLLPKSFFALLTTLAYLFRWFVGHRWHIITLTGSFLIG